MEETACFKQREKIHPYTPKKIDRLQEPTLLQQSRHLLVLALSGFALETEVPEQIPYIYLITELMQRFLNVHEHIRQRMEIVWMRLPALDVLNYF